MEQVKKCSKCGEVKSIEEFYIRKDNNKYRNECKKCHYNLTVIYAKDNREKVKQYKIKWIKNNTQKNIESKIKWEKNNPNKVKIRKSRYYKKYSKKVKEYFKKWKKNNPEKYKEQRRKLNKRIRSTPKGKLDHCMGTLIRRCLGSNKNGRSWKTLVGYTNDELKQHLENQFEPWMNWSNYGLGPGKWTVDHVMPRSSFIYENSEDPEFKKCWALENLKPMEWLENIKKSNKIIWNL